MLFLFSSSPGHRWEGRIWIWSQMGVNPHTINDIDMFSFLLKIFIFLFFFY